MKIGDKVLVNFIEGFGLEVGELLEHTSDWKSVTIKTGPGSEMTGVCRGKYDVQPFDKVFPGGSDDRST